MSAEENKAALREAMRKYNEGNLDEYLACYDESVVAHGLPPQLPANLDGLKAFYAAIFAAFPDSKVEAHDTLAEGDKVVARLTFRATHRGDFMGIPPTNREVSMGIIAIIRLRDAKIVERWSSADMLGLMQQLGAIPAPEGAQA